MGIVSKRDLIVQTVRQLRLQGAMSLHAASLPGYVEPDFVADHLPDITGFAGSRIIVAQAELATDLDSPNSVERLRAFCEHIRCFGGIVILATEKVAEVNARRLVQSVATHAEDCFVWAY